MQEYLIRGEAGCCGAGACPERKFAGEVVSSALGSPSTEEIRLANEAGFLMGREATIVAVRFSVDRGVPQSSSRSMAKQSTSDCCGMLEWSSCPKMVCSSIPSWSRSALGAISSNELGRGHRLSQRPSRLPAGTHV